MASVFFVVKLLCYVCVMVGSADYCWCCHPTSEKCTPCTASVGKNHSHRHSSTAHLNTYGMCRVSYTVPQCELSLVSSCSNTAMSVRGCTGHRIILEDP